ncbi:hypothetical protein LNQ49_19125 [Flavobacterium sp. F-65]|jgi:hypothetical protein|uniref:MORN repeat variant n=1 Tax=Flavobacterium pisciphilum TaxID=2893755 RepID=A0ABS8N017_9FLAO|nr:hypothetical protein [Flavobacterium sp. F-65]MCC9073697.1 hypothetical protein [Flavobacterium sp. F-65]
MKITSFIFLLIISVLSCNSAIENNTIEKEKTIISKIRYKKSKSEIDTLWVSQNDTTVFRREEFMSTRPCSRPELQIRYELINPKDGAYYFIFDNSQNLVMEGKYTSHYNYEGITYDEGNFYNSKTYYYKNGNLRTIHYQEDGRNLKTESFDNKKRLSEIRFIDKKSEETTRIEIYDDGQLEETRIYTSFDQYTTVKANN